MAETENHRRFHFYLSALRELGAALTVDSRKMESARPLRESLYRIMGTFTIGRGILFLWDEEGERLTPAAAKGLRTTRAFSFPISKSQMHILSSSSKPFHFHMPKSGLEPLVELLRPVAVKSRMQWVVTLGTGNSFVGLLLLGPRINNEPLSSLELEVLEEMAAVLALRVQDARVQRQLLTQVRQLKRVNRQLRQIYLETVRALAGVIDGPETNSGGCTHSARVGALASEIARRLGLPAERRQCLYLAGLLHDIGKQIIHREILGKPGPLSPEENRQLQAHPKTGFELINHLRFPWGDVAEIIRHHHERIDGKGYPDRLWGDQISVEAKILMMAEAFDSMTSDQPWRPRLSFEKVIEQIQENLGLQFEPSIVQALCAAIQAGLDGKAEESDFVPHLEDSFDPEMIRSLLAELRRQLQNPTLRPATVIIDAIKG